LWFSAVEVVSVTFIFPRHVYSNYALLLIKKSVPDFSGFSHEKFYSFEFYISSFRAMIGSYSIHSFGQKKLKEAVKN
tara:strand:+ start:177 stop:407 length:231 start_codon:yes stop_codon:yes gene_type:complete